MFDPAIASFTSRGNSVCCCESAVLRQQDSAIYTDNAIQIQILVSSLHYVGVMKIEADLIYLRAVFDVVYLFFFLFLSLSLSLSLFLCTFLNFSSPLCTLLCTLCSL